MRRIHSIVIHHTAGADTATAAQINRRHISNGWLGIGYHYVITRAGGEWHVEAGRDVAKKGAHAGRGFPGNLGSIGIAIAGNYVRTEPPREALTELLFLITDLQIQFGPLMMWGHCDLNMTACPGRMLYNWIPVLRALKQPPSSEDIPGLVHGILDVEPRPLAVDRADARYHFRLLENWAKGKGEKP